MMPAGTYYVGDLCYVLGDRWDDFCSKTIIDHDILEGEHVLSDGTRFASYTTMWGDGGYYDQFGNEYAVDAGLIGCVRVEDCNTEDFGLGMVFTFEKPFQTGCTEGVIWFDEVRIDTDPRECEYDWNDEWRDEEEEDYR